MNRKPRPEPRLARTISDDLSRDRELQLRSQIEAADVRDRKADNRERAADRRDHAADVREAMLEGREQRVHRREVEDRGAMGQMASDRERLLVQMRDANEQLVLASVRATEVADAADVARRLADDNEERFRSLVTASAAVVWQADADGSLNVHSESWRMFTGLEADTGDPRWGWLLAVHPKDREHVRDAWTCALSTSTPYLCQHRLQHRDGGYVWVVSHAVPIVKSGMVREWVGMMMDVTDHVRIEEAREQFVGILGHDLRNPVQAILMGAELLAALPEPYASVVTKIVRSGRRMEAIIRDVMDFARGRLGGGIPVSLRPCDLHRICNEVVAEMRQAHPDRDIGLELVAEIQCECDSDRIEQVLSNLLGNAVVHGADPIRVRVWAELDEIVMSVENQGNPIPAALLPKLFEPFSHGSRSSTSRGDVQGLGLGLYIVSEIVRAHAGTITVSSIPGAGTTFVVRYPRTSAGRQARAES